MTHTKGPSIKDVGIVFAPSPLKYSDVFYGWPPNINTGSAENTYSQCPLMYWKSVESWYLLKKNDKAFYLEKDLLPYSSTEHVLQNDPTFNAQYCTFYQAFLQAQNQQPVHYYFFKSYGYLSKSCQTFHKKLKLSKNINNKNVLSYDILQ